VPQYTLTKLIKLAMDGLVSFSSLPLKMVTRLGILTAILAVMFGLWVFGVTIWESYFDIKSRTPRGWASIACLVLMMGAVNMISLGIIGEYLSRIFLEVKGRPTFLIASIFESPSDSSKPVGTSSQKPNRFTPRALAQSGVSPSRD
jgi:dolichol-phosphate mannosyltransferase